MDRKGFFGEIVGIDAKQDDFFSLYKSALNVSFPKVNIDSFSSINELVDCQLASSNKKAFWDWMKKEGLGVLNSANSQIMNCIQNKVDIDNIYRYQKMVLEDISNDNTLYENIDILIDCLIGYNIAASAICNNEQCGKSLEISISQDLDYAYVKYYIANKEGTALAVSFLFAYAISVFTFKAMYLFASVWLIHRSDILA